MPNAIDCRGLSCPEPVIRTRQALQQAEESPVTVIVSNAVARDNISRAAKSIGWQTEIETDGEDFRLTLSK